MKKKIAIVNQRYGNEVNGGSEYYTKRLAEHLNEHYSVEVLTTTALDYDTWKPYYAKGIQSIDGVDVRRFDVKRCRNIFKFKLINKLNQIFPVLRKLIEPIWIKAQGPYCPELIKYIEDHKNNYDVFIFVTYLYYTTVVGLPMVADKSIFVPTAHDEYCIYFRSYQKLFKTPKGIIYLTTEEKGFVESLFQNGKIPNRVAGSGVDIYDSIDGSLFREKYDIDFDYAIYVGRVDSSKNCDELFSYFSKFDKSRQRDLKLVVVGKMMMDMPEDESIHFIGFISETEKNSAIAGAKLLIMPSKYESLSLVVLEAMSNGVPILVNRECEVLEAHCNKSKAGVSYKTYKQFVDGLEKILDNEVDYKKMKLAGMKYVRENYNWDTTIENYIKLIEL
jgi:glycosyltransferase involved in cell wall biosynthesis